MAENDKIELTGWRKRAQRTIELLQSTLETAETWGEHSNRTRDELESAAAEMTWTRKGYMTSRRLRREAELARKRQAAADEAERREAAERAAAATPRIRL